MNLGDTAWDWAAASAQIQTPHHQGICPDGWHLPSKEEWEELNEFVKSHGYPANPASALRAKGFGNPDAEGLDAFTAFLDLKIDTGLTGDERLDALSRAERERVDDTLRVISLSFSYEQGAASVAEYFSQKGGRPYEDIVYDRLGLLCLGKERFNDAAETFNAFVEQNPYHAQAPAFQMRVIETYRQGKFPTLVLQGKKDFVDRYNLQSDYWQHHDPAASEQVMGFLKVTMTDLSRHYHALAQKHRTPADYAEATHWYRSILGSFPQDEAAPDMNFLLAELLFE